MNNLSAYAQLPTYYPFYLGARRVFGLPFTTSPRAAGVMSAMLEGQLESVADGTQMSKVGKKFSAPTARSFPQSRG